VNRDEARVLLTMRAAFEPNSTVDEADLSAWSIVLDDIALTDATTVLRDHYRESTFPVRPADIVERVRRLRAQRRRAWETAGGEVPVPPVDPDEVRATIAWTRAFHQGIGSGMTTEEADAAACAAIGVERPPALPPATTRPALLAAIGSTAKRPPAAE
jgi:hypothetical protein